jgi:uncharacterized membrane protein YsdA (DUF1294 family)
MDSVAVGYLVLVLVLSLATFAVYWWDKRRATLGGRRISERTLHLLALVGGWPGALAAQRQFRHKTRKLAFRLTFWATVLLHVGLVAALAFLVPR